MLDERWTLGETTRHNMTGGDWCIGVTCTQDSHAVYLSFASLRLPLSAHLGQVVAAAAAALIEGLRLARAIEPYDIDFQISIATKHAEFSTNGSDISFLQRPRALST